MSEPGPITFVVAVHDESNFDRCSSFLARLGFRDVVAVRSAASIFDAYDEGWKQAQSDVVAFMHQDVDLRAIDVGLVLETVELESTGFLGAAGSRVLGLNGVWWSWRSRQGSPMLSGRVGHRVEGREAYTEYGPLGEVAVLDGVLLIAHKRVLEAIGGFHDPPLSGFDFYDVSATFRARLLGYSNHTIPVDLCHWGTGWPPRDGWEANRRAFVEKYRDHLPYGVGMDLAPSDDPQEILRLGLARHQAGDFEAAIAAYQEVVAAQPTNVAAMANLASVLRNVDRPAEAIDFYRQAVALDADSPEIWFNYANLLHQANRLDEAERCYLRALELDGAMAAAHFNLGNLLRDRDRNEGAETHYRIALEQQPDWANVHTNLGNLLRGQGRAKEAVRQHRLAVELDPENADVHTNLANALLDAGEHRSAAARYRLALRHRPDHAAALIGLGDALATTDHDGASDAYRRALKVDPTSVEATLGLSRALSQDGEAEAAEDLLRRAIALRGGEPRLLLHLARMLHRQRRLKEAVTLYERAVQAAPADAEAHFAFGVALHELGHVGEARVRLKRAVDLAPGHAGARLRLGAVLRALDEHAEAISELTAAVRLAPDDPLPAASLALALAWVARHTEALTIARKVAERHPESADAHMVTGYCYTQQGRIAEALEAFEQAGRLRPDHRMVISNTLFAMLYSDRHSPQEITAAHRELAGKLDVRPEDRLGPHVDRDPDRPLRIGYLSPDFRNHPVGYFMEPILQNHWTDRYEIVCYSDTAMRDEVNQRLRELPTVWRDTAGWDDDRLGNRIVDDRIDILVDLVGHTAANRSPLLARKPAPIQALYLGYPCTSGLSAMDCVIADGVVIPPDRESLYCEEVVRLPGCFLCFQPQPKTPEPAPPPVKSNGYLSFGNFNTLAKLSPTTIALWAEVLQEVPDSRLVLKSQALADAATRQRVSDLFDSHGIEKGRVELTQPLQPLSNYLAAYGQVDIVLDTLPYNGGTTTCDALWMGVPVVTLAGDHFFGRMGASILRCVGLADLVADSSSDYVSIAAGLAANQDRLDELRSGLRQIMSQTPLTDADGFTQRLEGTYREMWRRLCESGTEE